MREYNMNREWELISVESRRDPGLYECCPDDTFPSVTFKFVLQRHSGSYTAIVVVPAAGEYKYADMLILIHLHPKFLPMSTTNLLQILTVMFLKSVLLLLEACSCMHSERSDI